MQTLIKAILAIMLTTSLSWAESTVIIVGQPAGTAPACTTPANGDLLSEGWQGTGYEVSGTDTTGTSTVNPDYTLSGTPPTGSCTEGLQVDVAGSETRSARDYTVTTTDLTTSDVDVTVHLYIESATFDYDGKTFEFLILNGSSSYSSTQAAKLHLMRNGGNTVVRASSGAGSAYSSALSTGTWYTIFLHLDTTAADCYMTINGGSQITFTRQSASTSISHVHVGAADTTNNGDMSGSSAVIQLGAIWVNTP